MEFLYHLKFRAASERENDLSVQDFDQDFDKVVISN